MKNLRDKFLDLVFTWAAGFIAGGDNSDFQNRGFAIAQETRRRISELGGRYYGIASGGMGAHDLGMEPPRTNQRGSDSFGADRCYFIGPPELYNFIREEFRKQGLRYDASYYHSADAARAGIKIG